MEATVETVVAESSAAETTTQADSSTVSFEQPKSGTPEYAEWRTTGKLPEKKQPKADPGPADKVKEPTSDAADPETASKPQEQHTGRKRKPDAEARIRELTEENRQLKEEREKVKPAAEQPKPAQQAREHALTRPKPTSDAKGSDGNPKYATYEEYVEDLTDWKAEQREAMQQRDQAEKASMAEIAKQLESARTLYGKEEADKVIYPTNKAISEDQAIPVGVKEILGESEVFPHILFTIGSDPDELAAFIQMAKTKPGKAMRYIAKVESLIEDELAGKTAAEPAAAATIQTGKDADGKFTSAEKPQAPAKRGPESTPPPPLEVGGRGAGTMDESARALSKLKDGDSNAFRDYLRAENAKELRRRRGE
jgi:hypothetical protein